MAMVLVAVLQHQILAVVVGVLVEAVLVALAAQQLQVAEQLIYG